MKKMNERNWESMLIEFLLDGDKEIGAVIKFLQQIKKSIKLVG